MFRRLTWGEALASVVAASAVAVGGSLLTLQLSLHLRYPDFISGALAWGDQAKLQDLLVPPVFILLWAVSLTALTACFRRLGELVPREAFLRHVLGWSVAFPVGVSLSLTEGRVLMPPFALAFVGIVLLLVAVRLVVRTPEGDPDSVGAGLLGVGLLGLAPWALASAVNRLPHAWHVEVKASACNTASMLLWSLGTASLLACAMRFPGILKRWGVHLLSAVQVGLVGFYALLFPACFRLPDGSVFREHVTWGFKVVLTLVAALAAADTVRRISKTRQGESWTRALSPLALFAVVIALRLPATAPAVVPSDDYHFGEQLLGAWSWTHQGQTPYVDYFPAHGLLEDALDGFFSGWFLDGTASSMREAGREVLAFCALPVFVALCASTGSVLLPFVVVLFLGGRLGWFLFTPLLFFLHGNSLQERPRLWLTVWMLSFPLLVLAIPAQGLLLSASTGPIALWLVWRELKRGALRRLLLVLWAAAGLLVTAVVTHLYRPLWGAIRYVLENSSINQAAYGDAWNNSWPPRGTVSGGMELLRSSWMVVPSIALLILLDQMRSRERTAARIWPAVTTLLLSLLMLSYTMGRIDPSGLSRPGAYATFAWLVLVPLLVWQTLNADGRVLVLLGLAFLGGAFRWSTPAWDALVAAIAPAVSTPELFDGAAHGLPALGRGVVDVQHRDRLARLDAVLRKHLRPDETYLDLTSHSADYFYLNRRPALGVTAIYNLAPLPQQRRELEHLTAGLPRLALLEGENINHDGGGMGLRTPLLFRFVLGHYVPVAEDGFIVGVAGTMQSAEQAVLMDTAFPAPDLQSLPGAWGRSEPALRRRLGPIHSLEAFRLPSTASSVLEMDVSGLGLPGKDAGIFRFGFRCVDQLPGSSLRVSWVGDGDATGSLKMTATTGAMLVPLDASARWLTLKQPQLLRISLEPANACSSWRILEPGLAQRSSVVETKASF